MHRNCASFLVIAVQLLAATAAQAQSAAPSTLVRSLAPGESASSPFPAGALHTYVVSGSADQHFRVSVEPAPGHYWLVVTDEDDNVLADAWPACGLVEPGPDCVVPFFAERDGDLRIVLHSPIDQFPDLADIHPADSRYTLRLEAVPTDSAAAAGAQLAAAVDWLRENAHPLAAVSAGGAYDDLRPLKRILGGVRIVGLGEATHGTREFFQVKHRLLEFLVREMGFTLFAMELDQGSAQLIDDYVAGGRGTVADVLAAQKMWQWDTREVGAMIEWMRDYNSRVPDDRKVRFLGFDLQTHEIGRDALLAYLRRVEPNRVAAADSLLVPLVRRLDPERPRVIEFWSLPPEQVAEVRSGVYALFGELVLKREGYVRASGEAEYEAVLQHARRLAQFVDAYSRREAYGMDRPDSGEAARDGYMAENAMRLLDPADPDAKMVLWAANEHVRRDPYRMGYYLGERYGDAYYAFGLAFDRGDFRVLHLGGGNPLPLAEFTIGRALQGSLDWIVPRARRGNLFVDFRALPDGPAGEWFAPPRGLRMVGNSYAPSNPAGYYRAPMRAGTSLDGLIFIEVTSAARPYRR